MDPSPDSPVQFSAVMKSPELLLEEFQIPRRIKGDNTQKQDQFQCPCNQCSYKFPRVKNMMLDLAVHVATAHLCVPIVDIDDAPDTTGFISDLKAFLDKIALSVIRDGPRVKQSVQKAILSFDVTFSQYKDKIRKGNAGKTTDGSKPLGDEKLMTDSEVDNSLLQDSVIEETEEEGEQSDGTSDDINDEDVLLGVGLDHVRGELAARRAACARLEPSTRKTEEFLNKFELLRKNITDMADAAFDVHGGRDVNTGWSQVDYDEYCSSGDELRFTAFSFRSEKESTKRYYETDHIWEVQVMARAIRESQRFGGNYQLTLSELIHVFDTLNEVQNLNATPWKLNLYKGKLMKEFKHGYQVTHSGQYNTIESIVQNNHTYSRIFSSPIPPPPGLDNEETPAVDAANILYHIKKSMKQSLVDHFYVAFFYNSDSKAMRMLYAVMCSMFAAMFPPELDRG